MRQKHHLSDFFEEKPCRAGEDLVLFPHQTKPGLHGGIQGTEAQLAVSGDIDQPVQSDSVPHTRLYKVGGIVDQLVGGGDL